MKTKLLFLTLLGVITLGYAQQTYVPDDNFENYLETHDSNGNIVVLGHTTSMGNGIANDNYVTTANINTVTNLLLYNLNIANLTGIEDFVALAWLTCISNPITSLDFSQNTALTRLNCGSNQLTNLNVSQNTALTHLTCGSNQLTNLNVSQNTALTEFSCTNNQLTSLNVSQNILLTHLFCSVNQLTSIDVSQNTELIRFHCTNNQLTNLDVSQNTALTELYCYNNQLTSLDVTNGNNVNFNDFRTIYNPNLKCILVDDAVWSTINWVYIDSTSTFVNNQTECDLLNNQHFEQIKFSVYPNPVSDILTVFSQEEVSYNLVSVYGQVLKTGNLQKGDNIFNISNLSNGLYVLEVTTKQGVSAKKIFKE